MYHSEHAVKATQRLVAQVERPALAYWLQSKACAQWTREGLCGLMGWGEGREGVTGLGRARRVDQSQQRAGIAAEASAISYPHFLILTSQRRAAQISANCLPRARDQMIAYPMCPPEVSFSEQDAVAAVWAVLHPSVGLGIRLGYKRKWDSHVVGLVGLLWFDVKKRFPNRPAFLTFLEETPCHCCYNEHF